MLIKRWLGLGLLVATILPIQALPVRASTVDVIPSPLYDEALWNDPWGVSATTDLGTTPMLSPEAPGDCPDPDTVNYPPYARDVTYKTFVSLRDPPTNVPIKLNVYRRPVVLQPVPAIIMVHGGTWVHGCRWTVQSLAYNAAINRNYLVFAIDHRLACAAGDPEAVKFVEALRVALEAHRPGGGRAGRRAVRRAMGSGPRRGVRPLQRHL